MSSKRVDLTRMDPKSPNPTPAEEADEIGGDANPYPVGEFKHAREDGEKKAEDLKQSSGRSPYEPEDEDALD